MRGPIDYIIVSFQGNKFDGSILKALSDALDSGVIALVALSAVVKDEAGNTTVLDIADMGDEYVIDFAQKYGNDSSLVTDEDIDEVAEMLDNNSAAGLLVIEQLWAKPLKKALIDANATLLAEGRIHPDAATELNSKGE